METPWTRAGGLLKATVQSRTDTPWDAETPHPRGPELLCRPTAGRSARMEVLLAPYPVNAGLSLGSQLK